MLRIQVVTALCLISSNSLAITMRHDVAQDDYFTLASDFPAVGQFDDSCTGTLVGADVVITAAHCIDDNMDGIADRPIIGSTFELGADGTSPTTSRTVISFAIIPTWTTGSRETDLAVLRLDSPISNVMHSSVTTTSPIGMNAVAVGYGTFGTGLDANFQLDDDSNFDRKKRAAQNVVDGIDVDFGLLVTDFDNPSGTSNTMTDALGLSSSAIARPLEGATGPGDSGGPLFINEGNQWRIAGIASSGSNPYSQTDNDELAGRYGTISEWAPVGGAENIAWLKSQGVAVVPEPSSTVLVMFGTLLIACKMRHRPLI